MVVRALQDPPVLIISLCINRSIILFDTLDALKQCSMGDYKVIEYDLVMLMLRSLPMKMGPMHRCFFSEVATEILHWQTVVQHIH